MAHDDARNRPASTRTETRAVVIGCNCREAKGKFKVVDGSGACAIPDGVGGCQMFTSASAAATAAEARGLTGYGIVGT